MRNVMYYDYEIKDGDTFATKVEIGVGKFHCWGNQYDILKDGEVIQFTSAIVELPDGTVENVPAEMIKSIDNESMN
jgi:hypothetical protein